MANTSPSKLKVVVSPRALSVEDPRPMITFSSCELVPSTHSDDVEGILFWVLSGMMAALRSTWDQYESCRTER